MSPSYDPFCLDIENVWELSFDSLYPPIAMLLFFPTDSKLSPSFTGIKSIPILKPSEWCPPPAVTSSTWSAACCLCLQISHRATMAYFRTISRPECVTITESMKQNQVSLGHLAVPAFPDISKSLQAWLCTLSWPELGVYFTILVFLQGLCDHFTSITACGIYWIPHSYFSPSLQFLDPEICLEISAQQHLPWQHSSLWCLSLISKQGRCLPTICSTYILYNTSLFIYLKSPCLDSKH